MEDGQKKVAVITGASSGIGHATALEFAENGYDVVLAARRQEELDKVATQCEVYGADTLSVGIDTTSEEAIGDLAELAVSTFGRIDVWVNNAAVYMLGKFEDTPLEDMRRLMDVNFFGYVHGSHAALAHFREQGYGTLINISSVNAVAPQPYVGIYSASKAAVRTLGESLRMELELDNLAKLIHVCTVMPASIDTNLFQNGANYTGKEVHALEPVYDPQYVAKHVVRLATHPRREIIVGPAGKMMAMQNALMPGMYEKQISRFTKADLLANEEAAMTSGNLYEPLVENTGMRGGWRQHRVRADQLNTAVGVAVVATAGIALLGYLLLKRSPEDE